MGFSWNQVLGIGGNLPLSWNCIPGGGSTLIEFVFRGRGSQNTSNVRSVKKWGYAADYNIEVLVLCVGAQFKHWLYRNLTSHEILTPLLLIGSFGGEAVISPNPNPTLIGKCSGVINSRGVGFWYRTGTFFLAVGAQVFIRKMANIHNTS